MLETLLYEIVEFLKIGIGYLFFIKMFPMRRKTFWQKVMFLVLLAVCGGIQAWDSEHYYLSNIALVVNPLADALILTIFCQCKYHEALLWQWLYGITISIYKVPMLIARCVLEGEGTLYINWGLRSIWEVGWYLGLVFLFYMIFFRSRNRQLRQIIREMLQGHKAVVWGFCVLEWLVLTGLYNSTLENPAVDLVVNLMVCINIAVLMRYIYLSYQTRKREEESLELQKEMLAREQSVIKRYYTQSARQMHDMKHILLGIYKCISENETEKAKAYLEQYTKKLEDGQKKIWTGFPEIDLSVNYYYQTMQEEEIQFSLETDVQKVPLEEMDMMIILGNLLENAVEAAKKCSAEKRNIHLQLKNVNEMFLIIVENSSVQMPEKQEDGFVSSKAEKEWHGLGIKNVKRMIEKYGGDIQFVYTEEDFRAEIII